MPRHEPVPPSAPGGFLEDEAALPGWASALDLRRRLVREQAETLVLRAALLAPEDRALIVAVYRDGSSARDAALVRGVSARSVRQRIRALVRRMASARFEFVARALDAMPAERRAVARAVALEGRALRDTARRLGLSLHTVRAHAEALWVMQEAWRR